MGIQINGQTDTVASTTSGGSVTLTSATLPSVSNIGATRVNISGVSTFTNGPVLIGSGTSTGTASQPLQVTGGGYVSGSLGIGTTNPTSKLQVQGTIGLGASDDTESGFSGGRTKLTSSASGLIINHNDNSATIFQNQGTERLKIDGSGRVTMPYQPSFHVPKITNDTIGTTAVKLSFGTATYDVGSNYSDANDRFTAPVAGKYFFYCSINVLNSANQASISIRKNGSLYGQIFYSATNFPRMDFNPSAVFDMASGDYVEIYGATNTGTTSIDNAGFFGGHLIG
jgi:hypothetical protein